MQVVSKSEAGPDKLMQEFLDIMREGTIGHKPDRKG